MATYPTGIYPCSLIYLDDSYYMIGPPVHARAAALPFACLRRPSVSFTIALTTSTPVSFGMISIFNLPLIIIEYSVKLVQIVYFWRLEFVEIT